MRTQRPLHFFLSLLFFVAALSNLHPTIAVVDKAESLIGGDGDTKFINTSCSTTLYPKICYSSLARYANTVRQNPGNLARVAITVTLSKVLRTTSYFSNITRGDNSSSKLPVALVLQSCISNLDDAVEEIRGSLKQMREIEIAGTGTATGAESFGFQMSNVKTWMSSALTHEEDCTDELVNVPDDPVKADASRRAEKLKKLTSNALALVNLYANKEMP